jgi:hypothetical protein
VAFSYSERILASTCKFGGWQDGNSQGGKGHSGNNQDGNSQGDRLKMYGLS